MTTTPGFEHRGIVEGFYGEPYSADTRLWWVEKLGRLGMNRYVVAPKSDPLHRDHWREPYSAKALGEFSELVEAGLQSGVSVGFGASPGLSIRASDPADVAALIRKLAGFHSLGSRFLTLALDDVPSRLEHSQDRQAFHSLAAAHIHLAHAVAAAFPDATLWLVPNDYTGVAATDYLEELGEALDPAIEVAWTGRSTIAPSIPASEAAERSKTLRRRLLLWDNVPVADGPMRRLLHLGCYAGRDRALPSHASGILLNPMAQPRSSFVLVACAAAYLEDPSGYDPERAWQEATATLGAGAETAFRTFAAAHRFSPATPASRDDALEACFRAVERSIAAGNDPAATLSSLRAALGERRGIAEVLRQNLADTVLREELEPWIGSHHEESRRIDAAAQALATAFDSASNAMARALAYSVFEGSLTLHPAPAAVSYGPRRAFYPQMISHREETAAFGPDPALFTGMNLADEIIDFAEGVLLPRLGAAKRSGPVASAEHEEER